MIDLSYRCPCGSVFADTRAGSAVGVHLQRWMAVHENHEGYGTIAFSIRDDDWVTPTALDEHCEAKRSGLTETSMGAA